MMNKDELIKKLEAHYIDECTDRSIQLVTDIVNETLEWAATGQDPFMHVQTLTENYQDTDGEFTEIIIEECTKDKNEAIPLYRYPAPRVAPEKFNDEQLASLIKGLGFTNFGPFSVKIANAVQSAVRKQLGVSDE